MSRKWPKKASGAGGDHPLGQAGRLGHQVEVEADGGGGAVHHVPHVQGRQHVEAGQVGDPRRGGRARRGRRPGRRGRARPARSARARARRPARRCRRPWCAWRTSSRRPRRACRWRRSRAGRGRSRCGRPPGRRRRAATSGGSAGSRAAARSGCPFRATADVQGHAVGDGHAPVVEAGDVSQPIPFRWGRPSACRARMSIRSARYRGRRCEVRFGVLGTGDGLGRRRRRDRPEGAAAPRGAGPADRRPPPRRPGHPPGRGPVGR